jgi:hypothetical protein
MKPFLILALVVELVLLKDVVHVFRGARSFDQAYDLFWQLDSLRGAGVVVILATALRIGWELFAHVAVFSAKVIFACVTAAIRSGPRIVRGLRALIVAMSWLFRRVRTRKRVGAKNFEILEARARRDEAEQDRSGRRNLRSPRRRWPRRTIINLLARMGRRHRRGEISSPAKRRVRGRPR